MLALHGTRRNAHRLCCRALSAATQEVQQDAFFGSKKREVVGAYTPVTKELWLQRWQWTPEMIAAAPPQTEVSPRPAVRKLVTYPFSSDTVLREHYRNPWGDVRIGRILEDLDSLAGYIAHEHSESQDHLLRPPLLVTATVEAIELRSQRMVLERDLRMCGRVVWTGRSSMDICMELEQDGRQQLVALFTFVARDALTGKAHAVNPVVPATPADRALFDQRQAVNDARRAARAAAQGRGPLHHVRSAEAERWAAELLAEAAIKRRLPALSDANSLLMEQTALSNCFTCQPQQRNLHGRIFGGFLMRRAFELAHSTCYLHAGVRPHTLSIDEITFKRPVEVGDLISFSSRVLYAWQSDADPTKGVAHVQVEASVINPEHRTCGTTNTFSFEFEWMLLLDAAGKPVPPKNVLPTTEAAAAEVARYHGPGAEDEPGNAFLNLV